MRVDLPQCNFKNCKYCFDSNCTKKNEYERCEYRQQKADIEGYGHLDVILNTAVDVLAADIRSKEIKKFAEKIKDIDLYQCIEEYYKNAELCYEVRKDWFCEQIDNLVKEMTVSKNE